MGARFVLTKDSDGLLVGGPSHVTGVPEWGIDGRVPCVIAAACEYVPGSLSL
ncbi:hypothetical protein BTZ20_0794 [Rhodococcus sp. MTM3W5.2]|nr:hypothetical protein BTZ20_0794 [Rhodococcus sp. MTM3W5.2]